MNTLSHTDCLLLIDVQYGFIDPTKTQLINNLNKLTKQFVNQDKPINILEYTGCGMTLSSITDILQYYNHKEIIQKNLENGTPYLLKKFPEYSHLGLTFHVAGVNWTQCVFRTVQDLVAKSINSKIVLHRYASNPTFRKCEFLWNDLIEKYPNRIEIIRRRKDYVNK